MDIRSQVEELEKIGGNIRVSAGNVYTGSNSRKDITDDSIELMTKSFELNENVKSGFFELVDDFQKSLKMIEEVVPTVSLISSLLDESIKDLVKQKTGFETLNTDITQMSSIIDNVKKDTDDIGSLALNASIVSSKYAHFSGVFDILSNNLNEMASYISRNLLSITGVIEPILSALNNVITENDLIVGSVQDIYKLLTVLEEAFVTLKSEVTDILDEAGKIVDQLGARNELLENLDSMIKQMGADADNAIVNSSGNMQLADQVVGLAVEVRGIVRRRRNEAASSDLYKKIENLGELGHTVWKNANITNNNSKGQVDFSRQCIESCDRLVKNNTLLDNVAKSLAKNAETIADTAKHIEETMNKLRANLEDMNEKRQSGQDYMEQFNNDYNEMDTVIDFLKNILKTMNMIGILSRIESSREPEDYVQFLTISDNISALQNSISNNIISIEESIEHSRTLINDVNEEFGDLLNFFTDIRSNGLKIRASAESMLEISLRSQEGTNYISDKSGEMNESINAVHKLLEDLLDVVASPIRFSAQNIENGRRIEEICKMIQEAEEKAS